MTDLELWRLALLVLAWGIATCYVARSPYLRSKDVGRITDLAGELLIIAGAIGALVYAWRVL